MKRLKRWLPPLLTLLLIGAGAAMPWAAARFQDRYGIAAQEVLPFDPVSLTLRKDSEIGEILRLMGDLYDEADWSGETSMDEEDARGAAMTALEELDQLGLLEAGYIHGFGYVEEGILERLKVSGESSAIPLLCLSKSGSFAVIWYCCYWEGDHQPTPTYEILIDDATGKVVSGDLPCPHIPDTEAAYQRMERWRAFFQVQYDLEIQAVEDLSYTGLPRFLFVIDPEDGQGELGIMVRMYSFRMDFYPCTSWEAPPNSQSVG